MRSRRRKADRLYGEVISLIKDRAVVETDQVLEEESRIAFSDIRQIPGCPPGIPDSIAFAIKAFQVDETILRTMENGDIVLRRQVKFQLWDKGAALERLSRYLGLYEKDNTQRQDTRPVLNLVLEGGNAAIALQPQVFYHREAQDGEPAPPT